MPIDATKDDRTNPSASHDGTVQTLDRAVEPEVGTLLGQFRIEARIGQGGGGTVYRAYDVKLGRPVALKILLETSSTRAAGRLLAEARAAASLMHPSIAAIHDVQQQEGLVFIVMELVPGETLRAEIRRAGIPADTVVGYALDIASGLARAHAAGIVHRDLKPENVMITPEGGAKILDFGLAREAPDGPPPSSKPGRSGIAGTPSYMAPEQVRGDRVDARADVFAFGIVAYEMLTGKRPFPPARADAVDAPEWRLLVPLSEAAPRAPRELVSIVERCLSIRRADRFADGGELLGALRSLGGPRRSRVNRWVVFVPTAIAAALACALVVPTLRSRMGTSGAPAVVSAQASSVASLPTPAVEDSRAAPLRDALGRARSAWHAGDEAKARARLESIVTDLAHANVRAPSPLARVGAEASLLLGEIEESAIVAPPPAEPKTGTDLAPSSIQHLQDAGIRAATAYVKAATWGVMDVSVCATYRAGRAYEKNYTLARAAADRSLLLTRVPEVAKLYLGGVEALRVAWSNSIRILAGYAIGSYDAAVATSRFVDGPPLDPEDGSDCRASALARSDALHAADAGP